MLDRPGPACSLLVGLSVFACDNEPAAPPRERSRPMAEVSAPGPAELEEEDSPLVVFLGDSLTAGLGLGEEEAFPALLRDRLSRGRSAVRVVNAGVSGDTTSGGLSRLDWLLSQSPRIVVVGLGANDGLRGLPLQETEGNLREIVVRCQRAGARVLLLGMKLPPSHGAEYARGFEAIFRRVAGDLEVQLVPFLLDGVAADPDLNLPDGIHPNAAGHRRLADNVLPYLEGLLTDS